MSQARAELLDGAKRAVRVAAIKASSGPNPDVLQDGLRTLFRRFDTDGEGSLTFPEFARAIGELEVRGNLHIFTSSRLTPVTVQGVLRMTPWQRVEGEHQDCPPAGLPSTTTKRRDDVAN